MFELKSKCLRFGTLNQQIGIDDNFGLFDATTFVSLKDNSQEQKFIKFSSLRTLYLEQNDGFFVLERDIKLEHRQIISRSIFANCQGICDGK